MNSRFMFYCDSESASKYLSIDIISWPILDGKLSKKSGMFYLSIFFIPQYHRELGIPHFIVEKWANGVMREKRFDKARFNNRKHQNKRNARVKNFHRKSLNGVRAGTQTWLSFLCGLSISSFKTFFDGFYSSRLRLGI